MPQSNFTEDVVDGFKAYHKCGGTRDQVVREMAEYIYTKCEWDSGYDRSVLLDELIELVYN